MKWNDKDEIEDEIRKKEKLKIKKKTNNSDQGQVKI